MNDLIIGLRAHREHVGSYCPLVITTWREEITCREKIRLTKDTRCGLYEQKRKRNMPHTLANLFVYFVSVLTLASFLCAFLPKQMSDDPRKLTKSFFCQSSCTTTDTG